MGVVGGLHIMPHYNDGHQLGHGADHYFYFPHTLSTSTLRETRYTYRKILRYKNFNCIFSQSKYFKYFFVTTHGVLMYLLKSSVEKLHSGLLQKPAGVAARMRSGIKRQ